MSPGPPETRFIDMHGKVFDGIARFDESFYSSLANILNEEPVLPRDKQMMGLMRSLGVEKGKEFKPDAATPAILKQAIQEAHSWIMERLVNFGDHYWPGGKWDTIIPESP